MARILSVVLLLVFGAGAAAWRLAESSDATTAGSTCPPSNVHGCYQLTYTVSRVR